MKVKIDEHAKERADERGASEDDIYETLRSGNVIIVQGIRSAKEKIYDFNQEWNGKLYEQKQVRVIYLVEENTMIVITVVVKYGKFTAT
jgi:hypothetical protein